MIPPLVPASRTSALSPRSYSLTRSYQKARKWKAGRWLSQLRNSWCLTSLARKKLCPRRRRTSTHLGWSSSRYSNRLWCHLQFSYIPFLQILTGELPFHGIIPSALVFSVVQEGKRPDKPENASAIGFSDPLWNFAQRCWDADIQLRPEIGEVVAHLGAAATKWSGLMPPCTKVEGVGSTPEEFSDSIDFSEFEVRLSFDIAH